MNEHIKLEPGLSKEEMKQVVASLSKEETDFLEHHFGKKEEIIEKWVMEWEQASEIRDKIKKKRDLCIGPIIGLTANIVTMVANIIILVFLISLIN